MRWTFSSSPQLGKGVNKGYVLKDKHCMEALQGVLYLRCELAYQPVRAALRTLKPRENKLMEREAPFQRKVCCDFPLSLSHVWLPSLSRFSCTTSRESQL